MAGRLFFKVLSFKLAGLDILQVNNFDQITNHKVLIDGNHKDGRFEG